MYRINTYYGHTIDYIKPDPNEIDIRDIEDRFNLAIHQRFNVEYKKLPAIKSMDLSMLATEKEQLLPPASVE